VNRLTAKLSCAKLTATLAAFLVLGGGTAALATSGAAGGSSAQVAKKKSDRRVGAYRGTTEEGGTVSFRITRKSMVVGFTMPNAPLECEVVQQGGGGPRSTRPVTITAPPMKLQKGPEGGPQFLYEDPPVTSGPFQGVHVDGKGDVGGGMKGNAAMISWNGPPDQPGTERCGTGYVDWNARKVGGRK
jgi:hypothetical protein